MIQLDTNAAIGLLNGHPPQLRARFDAARTVGTPIAISAVVYHELMFGAAASARRHDNEAKIALLVAGGIAIESFTAEDAAQAAEIRAALKREGTPIGPTDLLIAAQARRSGAVLITANTREFERVAGLVVKDWAG